MTCQYERWTRRALNDETVSAGDALRMLDDPGVDLLRLVSAAGEVRMACFGRKVKVHRINNIKNGLCPEDCGYCSQSKVSEAPLKKYRMKGADAIVQDAHEAKRRGVFRYCMVASGRGPSESEVQFLAHVVRRINTEVGMRTCVSAGLLNAHAARLLQEAGLDRLNHNLNTSERHTGAIVSTHTYADRVATLRAANAAGLELCSGMIAGMGESSQDIVDVAYVLKRFGVASIPVNFLIPIAGNPVYDCNQLTPQRCLRVLCMFRLVNPKAEIRVAGGREGHLRGMQSLALYPANSLFVEGYLTTKGDATAETYRMIEDASFEIEGDCGRVPAGDSAQRYVVGGSRDIGRPETTLPAVRMK